MDYTSDLAVLSLEISSGDENDKFSRNIALALLAVLIVSALNSAWQVILLFIINQTKFSVFFFQTFIFVSKNLQGTTFGNLIVLDIKW